MKALDLPQNADLGRLYSGFYDDFNYEDTGLWTTTATDSGSSAVNAGIGGVVTLLPSDGTVADNDEIYFFTAEVFSFVADRPIICEALLELTEGNTDDANVLFGLIDAPAANTLLDNGAGPDASYAGAVFFKVDGGTTWSVENSDGGTQKTTDLDGSQSFSQGANMTGEAQTAGGSQQTLRIEWRPKTSTKADVLFWIDSVLVAKHVDQTYANATEMALCFGLKNGGANQETLAVDYTFAYQKRA